MPCENTLWPSELGRQAGLDQAILSQYNGQFEEKLAPFSERQKTDQSLLREILTGTLCTKKTSQLTSRNFYQKTFRQVCSWLHQLTTRSTENLGLLQALEITQTLASRQNDSYKILFQKPNHLPSTDAKLYRIAFHVGLHSTSVSLGQCAKQAVAEHVHASVLPHKVNGSSLQVLDRAGRKIECKIQEAFHIYQRKPVINSNTGAERSPTWNGILQRRYGEIDLALEIEFRNCHSGVMPMFA